MMRKLIPWRHRTSSAWLTVVVLGGVIFLLGLYLWFPEKEIKIVPYPIPCNVSKQAHINTDLSGLMLILTDPNERKAYAWIRMRINQMWDGWVKAARTEIIRKTVLRTPRPPKKILMYLGFLSVESGQKFVQNQFKGGFLGELVQWSDLIATLYVLGHDITVISEVEQFEQYESFFKPKARLCDQSYDNPSIIYTDIMGYKHIVKYSGQPVYNYRCRIRIMDCYGTEPAYNNQLYAVKHNKTSIWGGLDLHTQQFWTMFPTSPDNSFVGFVVRQDYANYKDMGRDKKDIALVYGKSLSLWNKKSEYLKVFHQNGLEVHSTIRDDNKTRQHPAGMPDFVINHGVLNGTLFELLRITKIFIGLGEPFEGPAPLEAIANGAVFVNPKLEPPLSYTKRRKPTERELTSQNPYVETYIGPPHVYTVEVKNLIEVDKTIKTILKNNIYKAFVPLEFTFEGYLQRISTYVAHQDFCHFDTQSWPPDSAVTVVMAKPGWSCLDTCRIKDLVCEPSHFQRINTKTIFLDTLKIHCSKFRTQTDQVYPAIDLDLKPTCTLQNDRKLFSCVSGDKQVMRICPCRNYIPQQTALCIGCEYT